MYEQHELDKWGVFYCRNDKGIANQFIDTMKKCCETISYGAGRPREFAVNSNRFPDWERILKDNLSPQVKCVVLLLPG